MSYTKHNPSDIDGVTRSQDTVIAVVVDDRDPNETGRLKCRILGEQDDMQVSDDQLPWYPILSSGTSQLAGVGKFPASAGYLPGTRIVLKNLGQQGFVVQGSIQSSRTAKGKEDRHPESTSGTPVSVRGAKKMHQHIVDGNKAVHEIGKTTQEAMKALNGELRMEWERVGGEKRLQEILNEAQTSVDYAKRALIRAQKGQSPMPISGNAWDFAMNAQSFVKSIPNGELIKGSADMLQQLKDTAQQGLNIPQLESIGGISKLMAALQSILAFVKKHKPQKKDEPVDPQVKEIEEKLEELDNLLRTPEPESPGGAAS